MNEAVRLAQGPLSAPTPRIVLTKPAGTAAQVIPVQPGTVLDLQSLAGQDVVLVHAGDRLIILFADQAAIVLTGFYGADGRPISHLDIDLGQGAAVPAAQISSLLPISDDPDLLPAAGPASISGNPPTSALAASPATLDPLLNDTRPLDLLAGRDDNPSSSSALTQTSLSRANTVPTFGGQVSGDVIEDLVTHVSGQLTIADADGGESQVRPRDAVAGTYGTFSIDAAGHWTYVLDNDDADIQPLGADRHLTETFEVASLDGSATETITVTVNGLNDVPVIAGVATGAVSEDQVLTAAGRLTIADVDTGESRFAAQTGAAGRYGALSVDDAGHWTYQLDNLDPSVQALGLGRTLTEQFTVWSIDGSASETVTITIDGINDVPELGGKVEDALTEDVALTATGALTIVDIDSGESDFVAQTGTAGTYGTFTVDSLGNWTYTLANGSTAVQSLRAGDQVTEIFTITSSDHSANTAVTITIDGTNDLPTIGGTASAAVTEDVMLGVTGALTIIDVDAGESHFIAQTGIVGAYGTFSINAAGEWTYALANASTAVQALGTGSHPTDTFTVTSADGTQQAVVITVNGTNDVPTLYGVTNGSVTEDSVFSVGNNLHITDRDAGEALYTAQTNTAGTYGTFSIAANGQWSYALDNTRPAVQALGLGVNPTETFKVWSADHSASLNITVTVKGANDVPTIGGATSGSVTEDSVTAVNGVLTIVDPDAGQSTFAAQSATAGTYGTFTVSTNGAWTYTLASNATVQNLGVNSHPTETFTVWSSDHSASQTVTVTVNGSNDAPAGANKTITTLEDTSYTFTKADFGFSDAEGDALAGVKFTRLPIAGSLTLDGVAVGADQTVTTSDIANGLLTYSPAANGNGSGYASIQFAVQDNGGTAHGGVDLDQSPNTITLNVTAVNDAPAGADKTITALEDKTYVFTAADFGFTDAADGNTLLGVKFTQLPGAGTLTLGGVAVAAGQTVAASSITSGSLKFTAATNASGNNYAALQFAVQDNGGTANGGVDFDQSPNTITLNVTAVNDAPAGTGKAITILEDTAYTFTTSDFGFTDIDGNALLGVKIAALPGVGGLTLNGGAVTLNQTVSAADITSGLLKFTPAINSTSGTSFRFQVQDDGGTANGGVDLDPSQRTIMVSVTGVNDAPVLDAAKDVTFATVEDAAGPVNGTPGILVSSIADRVIDGSGFDNVTDVDSFIAGIAVVGQNTSHGTWYYSANSGASWSVIGAVSDTTALLLRPDYLLYFKPAANYSGTIADAITFRAWDISGGTPGQYLNASNNGGSTPYSAATDTISLTVTGTNDAPVAQGKSVAISEDDVLTGQTVTATDADGNSLTFAIVGTAPDGLTFNADGTWSYTPPANFQSLDQGESSTVAFQYKANDGTVDSNTATVAITISGANDAPVAQDRAISVSEDGLLSGQPTGVTDVDIEALTYTLVGPALQGLTYNPSGTWSYMPPQSFQPLDDGETAQVTFQYKASDGTVDSNIGTVTITITGANDAPVAQAKSASVSEDGTLTGQTVTGTDVDVEDLTYALVGSAPQGLTFNTDGTWSYAPQTSYQSLDSGEFRTVTFEYKANDGTADSTAATVTITVTGVNDAPVAQDASVSVSEDGMLTGQSFPVTDIDNEALGYQIVGATPPGLTLFSTGVWIYTPPASFQSLNAGESRQVTFQYRASDGDVFSDTATVTITINGANDTPVAQDLSVSVAEDGTLANQSVTVTGGTALAYALVDTPPDGLTFHPDGTWSYAPPASFQALDDGEPATVTFQYKGNDGSADTNTATVTITIDGANDAPVAQDGAASLSEDGTLTGQTVAASDVDIENLTYTLLGTAPAGVVFNENGTWSYAPPASYQALDSGETAQVTFQYKANDGTADSAAATVTITINGANDAPVAQDGIASVSEDGTLTRAAPAGLTFNTDGTWSYAPLSAYQSLAVGQSATVSFQYKANDGTADSNIATETITITGANDAPVAKPDSGSMAENQATTVFNVLSNDTLDIDSGATNNITVGSINVYFGAGYNLDANDLVVTATPSGLQVSLVGTDWDRLAYAESVIATVNYTLHGDQSSDFSTNQFTLTVTGTNDAPVLDAAKAPSMSVDENAGAPSGAVGTLVSSLTDLVNGTGVDNVTDADSTVIGMAITGINSAAGTWYWSADNGAHWNAITGSVSESHAFLLNANYLLYFKPVANYSGSVADALTFRAWDHRGGTEGSYVDTTSNGGTTAYSTATDTLSVVVNSVNVPAVISGTTSGTVTEADGVANGTPGTPTATGDLNSTDADGTADAWLTVTTATASSGGYGTYMIDATGHWTYTLDNDNPTVDVLAAGAPLTDTFSVQTVDGTSKMVTIAITGTNDAAIISGATTGAVIEAGKAGAGTPTTAGDLNAADVDNAADAWQAVTTATATTGGYGTYTLDASGHWLYLLDNTNPTVNGLADGVTLTDTFTAKTADDTAQVVTVTITGAAESATDIKLADVALGFGGFKIIGEDANNLAGRGVASAGDVNGDGYDDVIVGAYLNDAAGSAAGAAYVVYGGPNAALVDGVVDLDTVASGIGGFKIVAQAANQWVGDHVSAAGDVNGDGYADMLVNAGNANAAYVVFGGPNAALVSGVVDLNTIATGTGGFKIVGENSNDALGTSLAAAGDVNGDGYADFILGANGNAAGGAYAGAAYVVYGGPNVAPAGGLLDLHTVAAGTGGFKIVGENAFDLAGGSVSSAGDLDGDGYDDLIVGAYKNDTGDTDAGTAYVVYGGPNVALVGGVVNLDTVATGVGGFKIVAEGAGDAVGISVASAGDVNGDGINDLVVGAYADDTHGAYAGAAYVVYGGSNPAMSGSALDLATIATSAGGFKIVGEAASDSAGFSVSSAGDMNGDGYADVLISAIGNDAGGDGAGAAYVIYGGVNSAIANGVVDLGVVAGGTGGFKINGEAAGDSAGTSLSSAGDVNGDGYDDIIIGAKRNGAGGSSAGAAYVIYGGSDLPNNTAAHIAGADTGAVKEDVTTAISGVLAVTEPDLSAGTMTAMTVTGSYGTFALQADGTWTYTLDNANSTVQALDDGHRLSESFQVTSADGTAIDAVTIAIHGTDEPGPAIALTEDVTHVFTASDFGQSGAYQGVTVDPPANAAAGMLMLGNAAITLATYVTAAQIAAGMLTWAPADDATGASATVTLTYAVRDSAGQDDPTPETVTLAMSGTDYTDNTIAESGTATTSMLGLADADSSYSKTGSQAHTFAVATASGTLFDDFDLARSDNNLEVSWSTAAGERSAVTSLDHFAGGNADIDFLQFTAGGTIDGYSLGTSAYQLTSGLTGSAGVNDAIAGSAAAETLNGNSGNDLLFGDGGTDVLYGGAGSDLLVGGLGDDIINGGTDADVMLGGDGNDALRYTFQTDVAAGEVIDGGDGTDNILVPGGNSSIFHLDLATVRDVEDFAFTSLEANSAETLYLTATQWAGLHSISMGGGTDTMRVNVSGDMDISAQGTPTMNGVEFRMLIDSAGDDSLALTGAQLDALIYNGILFDQGGSDTLYLTATSSSLSSISNDNALRGLEMFSAEHAAAGVDISLNGFQTEAFKLTGSAHDDVLGGASGADTITGGDGGDILFGGLGADILTGGLGADTFAFTDTAQGGDTIKDFNSGEDLVSILNSILGTSEIGPLESDGTTAAGSTVLFEAVAGASAAAQHDSARLIYDTAGHDLYYDGDGGASAAGRILLAHLENGSILTATDLTLTAI